MDLARILSPLDEPMEDVAVGEKAVATGVSSCGPLPALPRAIFVDIFASLVGKFTREEMNVAPKVDVPNALRAAACVSKEWNIIAHEVTAQVVLGRLHVSVPIASRRYVLEMRRRVTLQRKHLVALTVEKAPLFGVIGDGHWDATLSLVPRLKALYLNPIREHTLPRLAEILRAAARQCQELRKLILPSAPQPYPSHLLPSPLSLDEFQQALYEALRAWSKNGARKGVQKLKAGMHFYLKDVASACAYVHKLIDWCPAVQKILGYRCSLTSIEGMRAEEQWLLDVPTWTRFCRSLTHLKEFDWACVPFATLFFEIFGQFPKPHLKKMDFTPLVNWKWDIQLRGVDSATREALTDKGYAARAVNTHAALRACPELEDVEVRWSYVVYEDHDEEEHDEDGPEHAAPSRKVMNPEIFGDDFCEALATYCPHLEVFTLHALEDENDANRVISSFTDRGMRALARLPYLHDVLLEIPNITGAGLFALVVDHESTQSRMRRGYHIGVGEQILDMDDVCFYEIVEDFLGFVVASKAELPCKTHTVFLQLTNKAPCEVELEWSKGYLVRMRERIATIKASRPHAAISFTTSGYKDGAFDRIEDFAFSIGPDPEAVTSVDDEEQIDDVVWNRVQEREPPHIEAMRRFYESGGSDMQLYHMVMAGVDDDEL